MSAEARMNRLFASDGHCFDVAIDHGFFNEGGFLDGIENISQAVETVVRAAPDAVQLTLGQARHLQNRPGQKPALVLRTDAANVYGSTLPRRLWSRLIGDAVESAVRLDAACVVVNLLMLPDQSELHGECLANICALKPACERMGMPLMIEPLVMRDNVHGGGYMVDGDLKKIIPLVRQAVELGGDIIKADPCDDVEEYGRVIETSGDVPVLVRGGGRVSDEEILRRTHALMQQGARGIVYGRNVIQHPQPEVITRALMAVVHDNATPSDAMRFLSS